MNLRHAAMLALTGWYLMQPVMLKDGTEDHSAPLGKWYNAGSFDTAKECEAYRDQQIGVFLPTVGNDEKKRDALLDVVCIASDDPRLKSN
jgi:hypothetical protein